ncbi:hypothetical protein F0U61_46285 [Archangium violaceum]|nr:hypothetical protein F0U61_46285 [Archangium violaceum]
MATSRYLHTATLLANGKVLVPGGFSYAALATAEVYDPATGTWSATASMSSPRYNHTATPLTDGNVLVVGRRERRHRLCDGGGVRPGHGNLELHRLHVLSTPQPHGDATARWQGARLGRIKRQ